ncbi:endonuclease/exonuclease/phosphatase family protein [Streptomyces litchfieldiae]|uniref:Endonuclease/exonuclease/phosphatase family protein n=1 Tax=Streptomyces litchfieldiae TaxID=3075543 RepID=A0ABU2MX00_9ACTN|nr:endonuclease/exonuclease/phosphatase family protein [Streptomyces sp. DSM 44938]MDT0346006.1 endonuclease/exonuclease/phosphatase family protein [Streptomyces sp. DSM 44938]
MRILTWNLWWRFGEWERRREAILSVLREERPDICGLQEVWEDGGENLAGWLADELGMHWAWAPGAPLPHWRARLGGELPGVGNAVLSRWPIARSATERLPVAGGPDEVRVALYALIEAERSPVPFFTTHLHSAQGGSAVRCEQVRALARFVAAHAGGDDAHPPVVTGDFNAEPDSDEVRLLGGSLTAPVVPGQVLVDAWRSADPGMPWATWDPANPLVAGPAGFRARIDYIMVGLPTPYRLAGARSARRAGDGPVNGVWPSDHAAVVAELLD